MVIVNRFFNFFWILQLLIMKVKFFLDNIDYIILSKIENVFKVIGRIIATLIIFILLICYFFDINQNNDSINILISLIITMILCFIVSHIDDVYDLLYFLFTTLRGYIILSIVINFILTLKYKYKNNEMLYEVKLEVKSDEEMKESANLLLKEIDSIQDLSSKYFVTFKSKSSTVAQIRYLIYERYGEIPFKSEREFILEDNNSFTLVFSIKDKPKSIIIVFNKNTIVYNLDDIDGNIIYPKIKLL